jgi:hypothetical protein
MMSTLGGTSQNAPTSDGQAPAMDSEKMAQLQKMMGGNMPNLGNMANKFGGMGLPGLGGNSSKKRR